VGSQNELPGMEDRQIPELHAAALEYASIRDKRMELTKEEVRLRDKVLELMKKFDKETYLYDEVEVNRIAAKEKVKVKVHGEEDEGEDDEPE